MLQPQFAAFACAPEQDKTQASMPWVLASKQSKAEMASKPMHVVCTNLSGSCKHSLEIGQIVLFLGMVS